jgi:hypothetical protein
MGRPFHLQIVSLAPNIVSICEVILSQFSSLPGRMPPKHRHCFGSTGPNIFFISIPSLLIPSLLLMLGLLRALIRHSVRMIRRSRK